MKSRAVSHKQAYREGLFGRVTSTTLCGRVNSSGNYTNVDDDVTCKICLRIMADPSHYRWTRVIPEDEAMKR